MDFDLWLPTATPFTTPEFLAVLAAESEARGINRIWVGEHVVLFDEYSSRYPYAADGRIPAPPGSGLLEPLATLSFLAAQTSTVRLGTAVLLLAQRNPVYAAKELATLDWLSHGRVDIGVGVGWLREEFDACNVTWEDRGARTDEYLQVLQSLWTEDPSSFSGRFYELAPCSMFPKPVQSPHPPLHIGGESDAALRRVARFARGWHTFDRLPEDLAVPLSTLSDHLAEAGRNRSEVTVTVCPYFQELNASRVEQYNEAGADAVSALFFAAGPDDIAPAFDALAPSIERARAS